MKITSSPSHFHRLSEFDERACRPASHPIAYHAGCPHPAATASAHRRLIKRLIGMTSKVNRYFREQRDLRALAEKDDYLLHDIGISRNELQDALNEPFNAKPTQALSRTARRNSRKLFCN